MVSWIEDYEEGTSLESQIAHDADQLEILLMLKREEEMGNARASEWFKNARLRLTTPEAKSLAESISTTPTDEWWMGDRHDPHWVNGGK